MIISNTRRNSSVRKVCVLLSWDFMSKPIIIPSQSYDSIHIYKWIKLPVNISLRGNVIVEIRLTLTRGLNSTHFTHTAQKNTTKAFGISSILNLSDIKSTNLCLQISKMIKFLVNYETMCFVNNVIQSMKTARLYSFECQAILNRFGTRKALKQSNQKSRSSLVVPSESRFNLHVSWHTVWLALLFM